MQMHHRYRHAGRGALLRGRRNEAAKEGSTVGRVLNREKPQYVCTLVEKMQQNEKKLMLLQERGGQLLGLHPLADVEG